MPLIARETCMEAVCQNAARDDAGKIRKVSRVAISKQECAMGVLRCAVVGWGLMVGMASAALGQAPAAAPAPVSPQQQQRDAAAYFQTHYAKHEYHIAMRDGVKLFTSVYTPIAKEFKDAGPYPFLMSRTPYSCAPYGEDKVVPRVTGNTDLVHSGYILVCQDVRGRWASEGTWIEMTPSISAKGNNNVDES